MERFVIIVNGWKRLTIITKRSILDVPAVLDPPLDTMKAISNLNLLKRPMLLLSLVKSTIDIFEQN